MRHKTWRQNLLKIIFALAREMSDEGDDGDSDSGGCEIISFWAWHCCTKRDLLQRH